MGLVTLHVSLLFIRACVLNELGLDENFYWVCIKFAP